MNHISKTDITTRHLNLLVIFNAIFETQSVTMAAKRLRMSQPNLSRALRLLREEFDDPLFVRSSRGIVPTKRAEQLSQPIRDAIASIEHVYDPGSFEPSKVQGKFTIATTDYIEFLLAPALAKVVEAEAPGLTLNFRPSAGVMPKAAMEKGECDLAVIVLRETLPPSYFQQFLFSDPFLCAVRRGHPILERNKTLEQFLKYGHAMINPQGTLWAPTDEMLQKLGKRRRLVLGTPNALSAISAAAKSDLILGASQKFLEAASAFFPCELFKGPIDIRPLEVASVWHERSHLDPLHVWIRQKLKAVMR